MMSKVEDCTGAEHWDVTWMTHGRRARCPANPMYPDGMTVNLRLNEKDRFCVIDLPYPAPCCGVWVVKCIKCGVSNALTAAGRRDDPREVVMSCKGPLQ